MKKFIVNMLSANSPVSSKRVAGFLGWIVCLIITILSIFYPITVTNTIELLFWCSAGLLGLDSITGIWKKT